MELGKLRHLRWQKYDLAIDGLHQQLVGLRILHLSDIHIDRVWMPAWSELLERVQADPPDLICITGDLVDDKFDHRHAIPLVERFVTGLRSRLGTYAILGNHDTELLPLRLPELPLRLMCSERLELRDGSAAIQLIGLHGVHTLDASEAVIDALLPLSQTGADEGMKLVLSHYPGAAIPLAKRGANIVLAGHTHGGQVCLPGGIPLMTHDHLPKRFARGAHHIGKTWLVTSRGCGFSKHAIRLFCPAEAIEITLVSA